MQNPMLQNDMIRLSNLTGKNVVNLFDGVRLGAIYEPVIAFDEHVMQSGCLSITTTDVLIPFFPQ